MSVHRNTWTRERPGPGAPAHHAEYLDGPHGITAVRYVSGSVGISDPNGYFSGGKERCRCDECADERDRKARKRRSITVTPRPGMRLAQVR